jgi:hypothetical protein
VNAASRPARRAHQLIYVSAAKGSFTPAELQALLVQARTTNQRLQVSGILIEHERSFLQVLEGDALVVHSLFARIERDRRHHRVAVIGRNNVEKAAFGSWSMGFVQGRALAADRLGFNDFFRRGLALTDVSDPGGRALQLVRAFEAGRFRQYVQL